MSDIGSPETGNVSVLALCPCNRGKVKRKGQRNCHLCNVEANKKCRTLKRERKNAALQAPVIRHTG